MNSTFTSRFVSACSVARLAGPMIVALALSPVTAHSADAPKPPAVPKPPYAPVPATGLPSPRPARKAEAQVLVEELTRRAIEEADAQKEIAEAQHRIERLQDMSLIMREPELRWTAKMVMERQALVIPTRELDSNVMKEMMEDLNVMTRLLERECDLAESRSHPTASGIDLMVLPRSQTGARQLHLQGYGAVILLQAPFPLLAPETQVPEAKEETRRSNAWEEARRDLYGGPKFAPDRGGGAPRFRARSKIEIEYDSKRVERLKEQVLSSLKEAANMRHLGPDEAVTVVVQGPGSRREREAGGTVKASEDDAKTFTWHSNEPGAVGTLVVRAQKKDIDAYVAGRLNQADFAKATTMLLY